MFIENRMKITVINHYDLFPICNGGKLVIRDSYMSLAKWFDVNIIAFSHNQHVKDTVKLCDNLTVHTMIVPEDLIQKEKDYYEKYHMSKTSVIDDSGFILMEYHRNDEIISFIESYTNDADIVVAEHVYTWNLIKRLGSEKKKWYRAHNVEYDYKKFTWATLKNNDELLDLIYKAEKEACNNADFILTISEEEKNRFFELYDICELKKKNFVNIGAGYVFDELKYVLPSKRAPKELLTGFYIGTDTPGTREVVSICIETAKKKEDVKFYIAGSVCFEFYKECIPNNIILLGMISDEEKERYLIECDFAINIVNDGAGVNIKMFEYFAFGIPVISSIHGIRGIEVCDDKHCIVVKNDDLISAISKLENMSLKQRDEMAEAAKRVLIEKYDWNVIALKAAFLIDKNFMIESNNANCKSYTQKISYIPQNNVYIRCAGNWGKMCFKYLQDHNVNILGFIDSNLELQKKGLYGLPVMSSIDSINDGADIIVASDKYSDIVKDLLEKGVKSENIVLYYFNEKLIPLHMIDEYIPYYLDVNKIKREIGI